MVEKKNRTPIICMANYSRPPRTNIINVVISSNILHEPLTESNTIGCPPTDLKARTGEFTPPGIISCPKNNDISQQSENSKTLFKIR
jgi:hypothetical protein